MRLSEPVHGIIRNRQILHDVVFKYLIMFLVDYRTLITKTTNFNEFLAVTILINMMLDCLLVIINIYYPINSMVVLLSEITNASNFDDYILDFTI